MNFDRGVDRFIVCFGTFLHLYQLSPFGGSNVPSSMEMMPSAGSTILTITLLSVLTQWRPIRGRPRYMALGEAILLSLLELSVIVFAVECMLIGLWSPVLGFLSGFFHWATEDYLGTEMPDWMLDLFFVFRFMVTIILVGTIAVAQGWIRIKWIKVNNNGNQQPNIAPGCNGHIYNRRNGLFDIRNVTLQETDA